MKNLWRLNTRTGLWDFVRDVAEGNEKAWLDVFQKAEPDSTFKVAKNKPKA